jgi:Cu(I)/Ag(I) efflux system membrane fusion protein
MELVPATSGGGNTDELSIQVDPAARRVANIQTVAVRAVPLRQKIRAIGQIRYDEGALATISAYVDGRLDRLYADYTGVVVNKGDQLAWLYSPRLYTAQVELMRMKKALEQSQASSSLPRAIESQRRFYESARKNLIDLGTTEEQVQQLEEAGQADSRMHIVSPIGGTVIEKLAVEGQYVKTGQAIYRVADLSTVWLMLELFPEDAAAIRYGQKVEAEVQSIPGRNFLGRVAFIDPVVNPQTRTVGVRVVVPNDEGLLRIGEYATADIEVELGGDGLPVVHVYDPELAGKWISPRHPHVIESSPGKCRECGIELIPASQFGFADQAANQATGLVVPRDAVLMAGDRSVVYVETDPGRFEIRPVVLGPIVGSQVMIIKGVEEGEQVATSGNFLIDSQMQLAGNPSLIDPTKAMQSPQMDLPPIGPPQMVESQPQLPEMEAPQAVDNGAAEIAEALANLSAEDRTLAERQKVCPVSDMRLGSMGVPVKVDVNGRPVFICCEGCRRSLLADPTKYLAKLPKEGDR